MTIKDPMEVDIELLTSEEKEEVILQLRAMVELLRAEIAQLKAKNSERKPPRKNSQNSSLPPSKSPKPNRKSSTHGAKRGPKPGHPGKSRTRQEPDVIVEVRPKVCPRCGEDLTWVEGQCIGRSQVVEIPPIEPVVIEARRFSVTCPACGEVHRAEYPAGLEPERVFGPHVETLVTYYREVRHLPYRQLAQTFEDVFHLHICEGAIDNIRQRAQAHLEGEAETTRQVIQASAVVGSDETGARVDGENQWLWVFRTPQASYFEVAPSRSAEVIEEVMEDADPEVWVSDLFSAQLKSPGKQRQICHAHQLRDLQYAIEAERSAFAYRMQQLLLRSERLVKHRDELPGDLYWRQVRAIERACDALLEPEQQLPNARRLRKRYLKHHNHLFVFLYRSDVPSDNNGAERDLRKAVVQRKISGGFRSSWGAKAFATVKTVVETARKQGHSIFDTLHTAFGPPLLHTPPATGPP